MYKIIFGIPAMFRPGHMTLNEDGNIEDYLIKEEYEDVWCDFVLIYDLDKKVYHFEFETMLDWKEKDGCRNWIIHCLSKLTEYMKKNNYDITKELNMYDVFTSGINVNSEFETIEDAYALMKFVVFGFHGDGLHVY